MCRENTFEETQYLAHVRHVGFRLGYILVGHYVAEAQEKPVVLRDFAIMKWLIAYRIAKHVPIIESECTQGSTREWMRDSDSGDECIHTA